MNTFTAVNYSRNEIFTGDSRRTLPRTQNAPKSFKRRKPRTGMCRRMEVKRSANLL